MGVRPSYARARKLMLRAQAVGFQGLVVERTGCTKYAVVLHGLRDRAQAKAFAAQARRAGFDVVLRCRPQLDLDNAWEARFGRFSTRAAALKLQRRARRAGFQHLELVPAICPVGWFLQLDDIPSYRVARDFKAEARRAGFDVTIRQH